ncbi:glycine oxidase ThiO [Segnochrobactrum spirostomi]|uniref:Glycine oxidase ThiO n=1 Tax=Segnochrobactrum spirostomi TaxID=2608987 RepID=A0A6A7YCN6_9HYPH|nr:glycine oxidase ThiO [Segnochrobactrum spirostomi]MQT15149.1 glycine oxidase ThiO [Segnochrobactrum spirostomi]
MRVTIIGAGVAGLTTALALAGRADVEVLERGEAIGAASCSRFAGGMLAPWCERESAEETVVTLGLEALSFWPAAVPGVVRNGTLVVAQPRDLPDLARFARRTREHESVDGEAIAALEPDLAGRFRQGLFFPREAHLDPRKTLAALAEILAAAGVSIRLGVTATPETVAGDRVVDTRGLAAQDRLANLRGVKGEMLIVRTRDVTLSRPVRLLHPRIPLYVVPRDDGHFMIGATMIESGERGRITARSMVELLNAAYALHPAFAEAEIVEIGCDARPAFPDNLPRLKVDGRIVSFNGLYRHGFLLSPALARRAAEVVLSDATFPEVMDEDHRERRSA